ncbi:MucR family transcriptional regulator [Methylobacterium sp. CCH5-D2]|uniref:MucR family transcriptional regulator n=1 Tax=Methylobacterium sp. CCH5-D2 TaxID=1768765 RepID=UPI001FD993B3|nr:MucR family transcriptional regulator [Methylobacterium sp. CCH5-D2]
MDRTVGIVCAYVSNNSVPAADLAALISTVHATLTGLAGGSAPADAEPEVTKPSPAEIRKSIRPDGLISFIDGKSYKTLKRHLTRHGLDPQSYRARYGLPADYPTTSANYSAQRSALAKSLGLGQPGRAATGAEPEPESAGKTTGRARNKPAETKAAA